MNVAIFRLTITLLVILDLSGCGGGGYGGNNNGGGVPSPSGGATYTVGGTVTGLTGSAVLRINGANDLTLTADGAFTFSSAIANRAQYSVTVFAQPSFPPQACTVANGAGTIGTANVTNVTVTCGALPAPEVQAVAGAGSATLTWSGPSDAEFSVRLAAQRTCDFADPVACKKGELITNVTSPYTVTNLDNGQAYFFVIETSYANGAHGLSNVTGARPNPLSFDSAVITSALADDGTLYVGGDFQEVGVTTGSAVPLDAGTGRVAAPDFPIVSGFVFAIAADGAGGWYLGGTMNHGAARPQTRLEHILADGTLDQNFHASADGEIRALAVLDGVVYVGGSFAHVDAGQGQQPRNHLAAFNADGTLRSWAPSADNGVLSLAAANGVIYAGGFFEFIGAQSRKFLAAVDANGALLGWNPGASKSVSALAVLGNTIYAGGNFDKVGGMDRNFLAAIDDTGAVTNWTANADGPVVALAVAGNTVYAGGAFQTVMGEGRRDLAAIGVDGALLDWNPGANNDVLALAVAGETVFAGGRFTTIGAGPTAQARRFIAAIDQNGRALDSTPVPGGSVQALAAAGSTVYAGGVFDYVDGAARRGIAALDATGALLPWQSQLDGEVDALAIADGVLYAGGLFRHANQESRDNLAAFGADGALLTWNPTTDANVRALTVQNNVVYIGGDFTLVNGELRGRLAALDTNGGLLAWSPQADDTVRALLATSATVYVGGDFDHINGNERPCLVATDLQGVVRNMDLLPIACNNVFALAVSSGVLYVGGDIESNGQLRNNLKAFDPQGHFLPWHPFVDGPVSTLALAGDILYVGGDFTNATDNAQLPLQRRKHLAAFTAAGPLLPWNPEADSRVVTLAAASTNVYAGGSFTFLGSSPRQSFGVVAAGGLGGVID